MQSARPSVRQTAGAEHTERLAPYAFFLAGYAIFWCTFLLVMLLSGAGWPVSIPAVDLLLLSLATFRLTEIVTEEKVACWLRRPFCEQRIVVREDGKEDVEEVPTGSGLRRAAGEMILCPWCAGVWIATLLCFLYVLLPGFAHVVLLAFGAAAGALILQIFAKLMDRKRNSLPE